MKIIVTSDNFEESITGLRSKSFSDEDIIYSFLYEYLKPTQKKYLLENEFNKNYIEIQCEKGSKNQEIIKKYKHQCILLESSEIEIYDVLNDIFRGKDDSINLVENLYNFDVRQILSWLENISISSPIVARKTAEIEKHVYMPKFYELVVYTFYGCNATARWMKK